MKVMKPHKITILSFSSGEGKTPLPLPWNLQSENPFLALKMTFGRFSDAILNVNRWQIMAISWQDRGIDKNFKEVEKMIKLKNSWYDVLKWIALIAIPAIVTFLSVVLGALEVEPHTINVLTTILSAVGTLIGTLIGVSTSAYNKQKGEQDGESNS